MAGVPRQLHGAAHYIGFDGCSTFHLARLFASYNIQVGYCRMLSVDVATRVGCLFHAADQASRIATCQVPRTSGRSICLLLVHAQSSISSSSDVTSSSSKTFLKCTCPSLRGLRCWVEAVDEAGDEPVERRRDFAFSATHTRGKITVAVPWAVAPSASSSHSATSRTSCGCSAFVSMANPPADAALLRRGVPRWLRSGLLQLTIFRHSSSTALRSCTVRLFITS